MRPTRDGGAAASDAVVAISAGLTQGATNSPQRLLDRDFAAKAVLRASPAGVISAIAVVLLVSAVTGWRNLFVLAAVAAFVTGTTRRVLGVGAIGLFAVSFPPFSWPTWWFCFAPLGWIWRVLKSRPSHRRLVAEAVAIGFAMGWVSTGFVRAALPSWGWLIHGSACLLFSFQVVAVAVASRLTRRHPLLLSAILCALAGVVGELFEAWCGVSWSMTGLALTVADTPLAQWAQWIAPFGVSGLLYFVNFLLVWDRAATRGRCWLGPSLAAAILATAWVGGSWVQASVSSSPPFSALLVQPHLKATPGQPWRPWLVLDPLTSAALADERAVDLVVWPETSVSASWRSGAARRLRDHSMQLTIQEFASTLTPKYGINCLVGAVMLEHGTTRRYGLEVAEVRRYNCGCLISQSGEIVWHEKLKLVPLKEGLPGVLNQEWIRRWLVPALGLESPLAYGRDYRALMFRDRAGRSHAIAVAVCYESFLPWLPQYHDETVEAIVHLVYDGGTASHPGVVQRHIRACQYRAIETRKWNLVCATWTGSAIIDPSGAIVAQLPATAGVLRTEVADNGRT